MTSWSWGDEQLLRSSVQADEQPAQVIEYETIVLLGPPPLTPREIVVGLLGVGFCVLAAALVVGAIGLLVR